MNTVIRLMKEADRETVLDMMRVFYRSPAVYTDGSKEIFQNDVDACLNDEPYLEGYVFEGDEGLQGYAIIAKSFSTEFGKRCIWLEDLYVMEAYRRQGIGKALFALLQEKYRDAILRLEVEEDNHTARKLYECQGMETLPYLEMIRI